MPASSLKIPFSIHGEIEAHWVEALFSKQKYLLSALDASFLQDTLPHQHPQPRHERGQHPHLTDSNSPSNYYNIPCLGYFVGLHLETDISWYPWATQNLHLLHRVVLGT